MSRGRKPKPAAGEFGAMSTIATPLVSLRRPSRWASRGDSSAILAPANGLRPPIDSSVAEAPSGARAGVISSTVFSPWLSTSKRTALPMVCVASR